MREYEQDIRAKHHLNTRAALYAALAVGILFLFLPRGIPWDSLGLPTEAMGRALYPEDTTTAMLITGVVQLVLSVAYTFAVAAVIYRFQLMKAVLLAGVIGLALYILNYLIFNLMLRATFTNEGSVLLTHVAFCMIVAGAYKAFSIPKVTDQEPRPQT